jgi:hypothetical protein
MHDIFAKIKKLIQNATVSYGWLCYDKRRSLLIPLKDTDVPLVQGNDLILVFELELEQIKLSLEGCDFKF